MSDKEALSRIKIDKLLVASGWRLLDDGGGNIPFYGACIDLLDKFCYNYYVKFNGNTRDKNGQRGNYNQFDF